MRKSAPLIGSLNSHTDKTAFTDVSLTGAPMLTKSRRALLLDVREQNE